MFKKNFGGHGHSRFRRSSRPFRSGGFSRLGSGRKNNRGGNFTKRIDPAKFIRKAVITEEMPDFTAEHSFNDFALTPVLKQSIAAKKYEIPTPIQDRAISYVLKGVDVVGVANTGTGKTGAFLIPLLDKVFRNRKERVLVIVPTRELAIQIDTELKGFAKGMGLFSVCAVGGAGIGRQIAELRRPHNFIIGTPGRLKDLINRKMIRLAEFQTLVLDEADRMLDMGFVGEMRFVVSLMPKERQTLFFSATISNEVEGLIKEFLREPIRISVKTGNTAKNIEQDVVKVPRGGGKIDTLHGLLTQKDFSKVLVFARTKHGADRLSKDLLLRGFKADSIHGNKSHSNRQRALKSFKDSHVQVLVATDVAARGLDIADISHVINFDIPATYDDYVHRIGRTGRGNKKGKALTFIE
ncbi:MAG: ATP-dependent RNA helicase RhlE [Parcubacteria group bacterium GW2011_GWA2_47_21]|nr:MAG: ATP-dependent RNA helicase RhlE [Parcubacteria group bacterium GW2011_GWA2_47_21]